MVKAAVNNLAQASVGDVLKGIIKSHPKKILITGSLVLLENGVEVFYPVAAGIALDAVLRGDIATSMMMVGVIFLFWLIGAIRRAVDTRIYARIYADLAGKVIESERKNGIAPSVTIAHTTLARQFVDFFELQVPVFVTAVVSVAGSVIMLTVLEPIVGMVAATLLIVFLIFAVGFTKKSEFLASCLHHRQEREPHVVAQGRILTISRHFHILAGRRVALSDLEARGYLVVGFIVVILFGTLFVYLAGKDGVTAGHIYMLMSYIWNFAFNIDEMPSQLQQIGKIKELGSRINTTEESYSSAS